VSATLRGGAVYRVLGIRDPVARPLLAMGLGLPRRVHTTLLPFRGRIVYDGIICRAAPGRLVGLSVTSGCQVGYMDRRRLFHSLRSSVSMLHLVAEHFCSKTTHTVLAVIN
jgi:hypothetical protein